MEVIKIICIGGGGNRGKMGGICYIKIKEDWGYNRALRNAVWTILDLELKLL